MLGLPRSVASRIEMRPVEDLALAILRDEFPDMTFRSLYPGESESWPERDGQLILVRRHPSYGTWDGDTRFIDYGMVAVHVLTYGDDADERAALITEAIRIAFRDVHMEQRYYPGLGSLADIWLEEEGVRKSDWATSEGPVQYADLPIGWQRYESRFHLKIRRPIWG